MIIESPCSGNYFYNQRTDLKFTQNTCYRKFRHQVRFQNGQVFDLAILKPGFELAWPFQNQGRFQNGQVNNLALSKGFKMAGNISTFGNTKTSC